MMEGADSSAVSSHIEQSALVILPPMMKQDISPELKHTSATLNTFTLP